MIIMILLDDSATSYIECTVEVEKKNLIGLDDGAKWHENHECFAHLCVLCVFSDHTKKKH